MSTAHQIFAERLNVSSIWVRELARKGRIYPAHKVGKNWVFFDSSTVIRAFERTGRAPQKMILQHLAMILRQQAPWEDESLFDRPAQKDSAVRKKGGL